MIKKFHIILLLVCAFSYGKAQTSQQVTYFDLQEVQLTEGPFWQAQQTDLRYILAMDPDRLLAPYLREAGLTPKAPSYTNWENTGLDGHIGGHYLSALSMMYAATGNKDVQQRLEYMLEELHRAQKQVGTGFLGGTPGSLQLWKEIQEGHIHAGGFDLNGKWVPLYNIHKIYAGLRDAYQYAQSKLAKEMLIRLTDWMIEITENLRDDQIQEMLRSEHGGLNEIFADVAAITGKKKYLTLAQRFSHQVILDPLLQQKDQLTGLHANTQIPKVIGYKRMADLTQNQEWDQAARYFWNTVVKQRSVCIGGNSVREHFHPADNFSSMVQDIQGPETCNTYNMLRLTKMLYQGTPEVALADYYEKALYNHILSSQHPEKGGFVYFTPMRAGHYRVYSQPETSMWCCVGSGLENHTKYGEFIYAHTHDALLVNLFIPSTLQWKEKGLVVTQKTQFPDEQQVTLQIQTNKKQRFALKIRCPQWTQTANVWVNGKKVSTPIIPGEYITLNRTWKNQDEVQIEFAMQVTLEQLPDHSNHYAFMYGPIVLATPMGTEKMDGLFADDSRGGHIAHGEQFPLQAMPILAGTPADLIKAVHKNEGKTLSFSYQGKSYPAAAEPMRLIPFFRLHESRYAIYFQQADEATIKRIHQEAMQKELQNQKLAQKTIDLIYPGEQQPESDHHIRYERSETGIFKDRHFRRAQGWFSYELKQAKKGQTLLIMVHKADAGQLRVMLQQQELTRQSSACTAESGDFIRYCYRIEQTVENEKPVLQFLPDGTEWTPAIYEIRLIKE